MQRTEEQPTDNSEYSSEHETRERGRQTLRTRSREAVHHSRLRKEMDVMDASRSLQSIGRESVGSASGPASPVLRWCGRRVGSLGPGLTSDSADAARLSCETICRPGPRFLWHPPARPVCSARPGQEAGVHRSDGQRGRATPQPLHQRKGMALTIVETRAITGGVDTHADTHVAAALDPIGGLLGVQEFPATTAGYAGLLSWLGGFGTVCLVGIEGTGSYGAGLTRHVTAAGVRVVEVDRSDRQDRRRQGKSDPLDAVSAARAAQSGRARGAPKGRDGT